MFTHILVPLDGSVLAEAVIPHVIAIARAFDASVTLLRVMDKKPGQETTPVLDVLNWQIAKADAQLYLEKIAERLHQAKLNTREVIVEGAAAETVVEFVHANHIELVILSTHGHTGLGPWGMSSVTQKIIYSVPASVCLIRAHLPTTGELVLHDKTYQNILAPLDGSWRAESVLPATTLLSRTHDSKIHLAHIVKLPEVARHIPLNQEDQQLVHRLVERNRSEATRYLEQICAHSPLTKMSLQSHLIVHENAAVALHDVLHSEKIDLVILSAHGYSGSAQWPYGSMVNHFILYGKTPLLIVQDLPSKEDSSHAEMIERKPTEH